MEMEDFIAKVHAIKNKKKIIRIAAAAFALLLLIFIFTTPGNKTKKLKEEVALKRAPALALTEEELALAQTILEFDDFRNALNYDLVDNTTLFTLEETEEVIASVLPENANVWDISVVGAVIVIDYFQPQHHIILEYADADRSGTIDQVRKSLMPKIDNVYTGCYTVDHNFTTEKTAYTYTKY